MRDQLSCLRAVWVEFCSKRSRGRMPVALKSWTTSAIEGESASCGG